ncbi:stage V sporulation protein AB [Cohnella sp. CFH 77786]|uniref:stage V sporulation protein AB n=1 Tax=Cohnella sp. CFH 77786 TaxID=2662265 RepID=UPI001C610B54|nr:stage V sporulation protein AB [Cohnella sp. CFH 77786]MBW5446701.1 stage V sporulation protein AB [Cohnella sp. CFH 77786]
MKRRRAIEVVEWLTGTLLAVIGLAGGFAVGSAFVALLIVLDLIPRLVQLTKAYLRSGVFESAILGGALYWCCADQFGWILGWPDGFLLIPAVFHGVFVGMFAAALTEVLNVLPILSKKLRLKPYLFSLLMAMVLGKVAGSLIDWLWFQL